MSGLVGEISLPVLTQLVFLAVVQAMAYLVGWAWHKSARKSRPVKRLIMLYITIIYKIYVCVCILLKLNQTEVNLNRLFK